MLVTIVVVAALAAAPLFTVYRSSCREGEGRRAQTANRYSFVLPWNEPPKECRNHKNGFEILTNALGWD